VSLRAVIFDVDGVLVRSMEKHHEAYVKAFQDLGVAIRQEEVFANEGRRSREVIETLAQDRGLALSTEQLDEMNRRKQETFFGFGPLPLYPGVPDLIAQLKDAGLLVAAVTGTNRKNVDNHLGALTKRFDAIVTADDVKRTKPHPEPYLAALAKLDVEPGEALVVENATLGIRSAKAAGLRVVGVTSTLPADMLREADFIVDRVADAWKVVEDLR
jgi:beta-phosphoglucomutase